MKPDSRYSLAEHKVDSALEMLRSRSQGPLHRENDCLLKSVLDDLAGAMEELRAAHAEVDAQREELDKACHDLSREHQRYVELFEDAPDGYVVTDLHGVIGQANRAAVELLQSARDRIVGKPLALYVHKEDRTAFFQQLIKLDALGAVKDLKLRFQSWRGGSFRASVSIAKVQIAEREDISLRWLIRDISSRDQTGEVLSSYRFLADHSRDIILFIRWEDGRILEANAAAVKVYGYSHEELLRLTIHDVRAHHTRRLAPEQMREAERGGIFFETAHQRRDGSVFPVEVNSRGETIGGVRTLISVVRDITERKLLEEALCESEERLRLFVEHAPVSIAMFDRQMRYIGFSRRWLTDHNLGGRDLRGVSHYDVFPEIPDNWKQVYGQALNGDVLRGDSERVVRADGAVRWLRWEVRPWHDAAGKIGGILVLSEDITDRKRAEDGVQRSEAMLRAVVDQMPSGVTVRDASTGALILSNGLGREIMGALVDSPELSTPSRCFRCDGRQYSTDELPVFRSLATGEVVEAEEIECERSDGARVTLSVSSAPVRDLQGQIVVGVSVFQDITRQKTAEQKLKAYAEQLEALNKELEQFFFIAAHDLQEPLRKIRTFGDMLSKVCKGSIPDEGEAHLKRIKNAAKRMSDLLSALLLYSRTAVSPMHIEHTNLTSVAQMAIGELRKLIHEAGAKVVLNELPELGVDPAQIRKLFELLIGNSLKFRGEQERPTTKISARVIAETCEIRIEDNGIGFDETYLDKIFTPFQQLHGPGKYEGTGMGLSVCRKIAERHGGSITAKSTPGVGATFIVTLPLRQNANGSPGEPTSNGGEDAQRLIHELRVHQIELEMQNDELRNLQAQIEESHARYADLYDFAPVGYLTFDEYGRVVDLNLTAARQFGVERRSLINKSFLSFVFPPDKKEFLCCLSAIFGKQERQICELRLSPKDGEQFHARLESIYIRGEGGIGLCRSNISDITQQKRAEHELQKAHDELERCVMERTAELQKANVDLENSNTQLFDTNKSLSTFVQNIENQRAQTENEIAMRLRNVIMPMVVKLKDDEAIAVHEGKFDMLIKQIEDLSSGFFMDSRVGLVLSNTELQIASLVKNGMTIAQISRQLHISLGTASTHRKNIRKKLKINDAKCSLRDFLNSKA